MSKTIAVRVDAALEKAIEERARASGMTVSEVVRETLREALAERPLSERIGHPIPAPWSLLEIVDVLTLDRRGFSTYRTREGRGFRLVLDEA